jgi:hypothetical protein
MNHPVTDIIAKLGIATIIALALALLDEPATGIDLAWWWCAIIGLVVAFGGWRIIVHRGD